MKGYYNDEIGRNGNMVSWFFAVVDVLLFLKALLFNGDYEYAAWFSVLAVAALLYEVVRYGKVAERIANSADRKIEALEKEIQALKDENYNLRH